MPLFFNEISHPNQKKIQGENCTKGYQYCAQIYPAFLQGGIPTFLKEVKLYSNSEASSINIWTWNNLTNGTGLFDILNFSQWYLGESLRDQLTGFIETCLIWPSLSTFTFLVCCYWILTSLSMYSISEEYEDLLECYQTPGNKVWQYVIKTQAYGSCVLKVECYPYPWSTSPLTLDQQLAECQPTDGKLVYSQPTVNQAVNGESIKCQPSGWWSVDRGHQSRVSVDTRLQLPLGCIIRQLRICTANE